ncbi:FGGY family carbohydrate kinase [Petrotoga sp. 9PWA.NaAc.5.4]|uniref:FGGY family carbohydrate kinase n=1 Tax=Petrotoga sp. 9PWA.NaAc.5.4 TaxID=1434328 RepID=UPI000CB092C0|nr:FGGY family carbohydrate kinase [Petrotoga sp. 9PWA.NaAc.5.4]PNR94852.1 hypothetical protein X924_05150 [Petrotoga sp. 9PWA.NaAc.5.4]
MFYLGVDVGTSTMKATVLNEEGRIIVKKAVPCELLNPKPGFFEVDANKSWKEGFIKICEYINKEVPLQNIRSICISSVCASFVPVNKKLDPLYNAILYGIDSRAIKQIDRLNKMYEKKYLVDLLGGIFTTHSVLPKFLWLKENKPEIWEKTSLLLESSNFISSWLTGKTAWDFPTASGAGLINLQEIRYASEIFKSCGFDENKLPPLKWPLEVLGEVSYEASKKTGLKKGTFVLVGACDINAELIACGVITPGKIVTTYGSTTSFILLTDHILKIEGFRNSLSSFKDLRVLGGATSSGARFLKWMGNLLSISVPFDTQKGFKRPTGLLIHPYLDGARTPYDNPQARVTFYGMTSKTTAEELFLASFESLGYELASMIKKIKSKYSVSNEMHSIGGLSHNDLLMQIVADITGIPNKIHQNIDTSFGDALMAMTVDVSLLKILKMDCISREICENKIFSPSESIHDEYINLLEKFERLYLCIETFNK